MSILDRIRRIAKANMNWLLDQIEPPEQELTSRIGELTEVIQEGKAAAATYGATFRRLERQAEDLRLQEADLTAKAEAAVGAGDETTARALLAQKVQVAERLAQMGPGLAEGRRTYDRLREDLGRLQDALRQARAKLAELRARQRCAEARKAFHEQADAAESTAEADLLDRLEDDVLQTEAEADVAEDIHTGGGDLEQRSRELQIEAELAAMKDRLSRE